MGDSTNTFDNFELLLEKSASKRPSAIYNTNKNTKISTIKPQDVLNSVYSQIKTIQLADGRSNIVGKKLSGVKSSFLAVNKLPQYKEVLKQTNTFETQCVSDTQLINIIEDAEALIDTDNGMTQEFDTNFTNTNHSVTFSQDKIDGENIITTQEFDTTFSQTNVDKTVSFLHDRIERDTTHSPCNENVQTQGRKLEGSVFIHDNVDTLREICDKVMEENKSSIKMLVNKCIENNSIGDPSTLKIPGYLEVVDAETQVINNIEVSNMEVDNIEEERPPSPVLKLKTKTKKPQLVVSLESFERFERIAIPLIDSNNDFDTCKHLINSQILEGELYLNTENVMFNENEQLSPIIKKSCDIFQDNEDLKRTNNFTNLNNLKESIEKTSCSLIDEILFSSDEDNDFIYREFQDMPLTAALETSFYDHSNVFEETMYVGFQTASNKSIQICTNSYHKAQFILDEDDNINGKDFSLTELVEICDEKSIEITADLNVQKKLNPELKAVNSELVVNEDTDITDMKFNEKHLNRDTETIDESERAVDYDDTIKKPPEKECFVGFKTASNKKINLSDKALDLGKKVFKNIDIDEKDLMDQNKLQPDIEKTKVSKDNHVTILDKTETENDIDGKINDDLIIQEFENIEMSLEEKEKSYEDQKDSFLGFKTASNRNIGISDAAKAKIKEVFQDIDLGEIDDKSEELDVVNIKKPQALPSKMKEKKDYPEVTFTGFKTANNKNIKISAQALEKTKSIFQDVDKDIDKPVGDLKINNDHNQDLACNIQPSTRKTAFIGFKNANNNDIKISEVAMSKSSKIFKNIDLKILNDIENEEEPPKILKMASNKSVNISEQALVKSRKIFQDVERRNEKNTEDRTKNCKDSESFGGFKTANVKAAVVSKETIARSNKLYKDFDIKISQNSRDNQPIVDELKSDSGSFIGFQTASYKPVSVSAHALERSKYIFQDIDANEINIAQKSSKIKDLQTYKDAALTKDALDAINVFGEFNEYKCSVGFKTASNKKVNISKDALTKYKKIFNDLDDLPDSNDMTKEFPEATIDFKTDDKKQVETSKGALEKTKSLFNDIDIPEIKKHTFKGFQTANNKQVEMSKEALEKTKSLFNDIDIPEIKEYTFKGFKTANNKQVEISKEALEKTKSLFNDIDIPEIKEYTFKGFQTANNKQVEMSKEALEKTKSLFNDIDIPEIKEYTFKGFQTANNKQVEISKEALEKTKSLFNDIDIPEIKEHTFKGFQTANNKQVEVSKEPLKKTKSLFNDIDIPEIKEQEMNMMNEDDKHIFSFQTANNKNSNDSENALNRSRMLLEDSNDNTTKPLKDIVICDENKTYLQKGLTQYTTVNIDTQILNHFEKSLCTEDFNKNPVISKRSGSPILSCPRAKRRKKFETPYKEETDKVTKENIKLVENEPACTKKLKFSENYKKSYIYKLKDLNFGNGKKTDIDQYITNFNLENILNFEFIGKRNELTDTKMSIDELKSAFLCSVNKNLVPEEWLDNHIKLIMWKLLSYEIAFPNINILCTVQNVIDQLKYRYDKELYNADRPVLRKIFERDDVATKTMVLCVAGIHIDGVSVSSVANTKDVELLLTDGWYFIKATIDKMLLKLVYDGRIVVGCKIVTSGAELINCNQGIAPWEDTSAVRLKIFGNSTRPASWHAKLGHSRAAILTQLPTVKVDGGKISRLRVFVTRVYPMLYVEKFADGSTVTRSERLEHLHQIKYETERELMMERIYEEVQKEFSDQDSQETELIESGKRECYDSGSQIAKMMKLSKDPTEFRAELTTSQIQLLQEHTCKYREKLIQAIQKRVRDTLSARNVVTLARGRIATVNDKMEITKGMLTVWKPNDAILELFKEGCWIEIMNTIPTAMRYSEIQISAGRQSVFRPTKSSNETPQLKSLKRTCYKISDVTQRPTMTSDYNEIDTVGMVFLIEPSNREFESHNNFQNVYLSDAAKNIISLSFWGGVKKFGFENILDTGQIVACSNLQRRAGNTRKNIPQFRVTEFTHFTKTAKNVQAREMMDDLNKKLFGLDRRKFCDDCITIKNNYTAIRFINNSENESPYRINKSDYSFARNKMFIDTPQGVKPNKNEDVNLNLTGLDFESSFKQETLLSPNTMLRKKKVNERISKLKMYGEPPPLSPISIINKSVNAKNSYKSPLISITSVATPNNLPRNGESTVTESPKTRNTDRERSPVISVKRSYLSSVPVKLNFANENKNDLVDHFAEEFDGSPPLSLD